MPSFWRRLVKAVDSAEQFELTCRNSKTGATERHFIEPVLVVTISGDRMLGALDFNREEQSETLKFFSPRKMQRIKQTEMDLDWLKARRATEERKEERNQLRAIRHAIRRGLFPESLLELLPARSRELIHLKFNEKLSCKEISTRTGLSIGNVRYILHRAVIAMAEELAYFPEPV